MENLVCWVEIPVLNMERAILFYSRIFEIDFHPLKIDYTTVYVFDGSPLSGGAMPCLVDSAKYYKPSQSGTLVYFSCEDSQKTENRIIESGGKILVSRRKISNFDYSFVIFLDSEGNRIGLRCEE